MYKARNFVYTLFFLGIIVALVGGFLWANLKFVPTAPGGADFIQVWKSMRNLMMDGISPYSADTSRSIQILIYGRPSLPGQYPYNANVPLFMLVLFIPWAWIGDLELARAIWMVFLEVGLFLVAIFSLRLSHWKPNLLIFLILMLFSAFWQPSVSMLVSSTSIILQAFFFFGALRSIELKADELAGALAALCLLNIEATGLVFLGLIIWVFSTQRWRILGGIGMLLAILGGLSILLQPSWVLSFIGATLANWQADAMPSTYNLFEVWMPGIGQRIAQIIAIGALTIVFLEWRAARGQDVRWLFWTSCLVAAITPLLGIPYFPQWTVFTLPGVLLVVSVMIQRWRLLGLIGSLLILSFVFWALWQAQINGFTSVFILFYPIFLTLLLYWVRWGAVRQPRLWADEIMLRGSL